MRSGLSATRGTVTGSAQVSHVARTFADALNSVTPSANRATRLVPAYTLVDLTGSAAITRRLRLMGGVSNALDRQYFTKRPQLYPGPGVWPSDGRGVYLSLDVKP